MVDALMDEAPAPEVGEDVAAAPAPAPKPAANVHRTSIYVPLEAHERLREIAFAERKKYHDLVMEGIDLVIQKRGHGERSSKDVKAS